MNLGSPDSTSVRDVKRYLEEFLMDKRVIDSPYLSRLLLVKGIIVPFRAPKTAKAYKSIWTNQGSPLIVLTGQLQRTVQTQFDEPVEIAMRYGNPTPDAAYRSLLRKVPSLEEVILVPLYPHYAMSSYETAVEQMKEVHKKNKYSFSLKIIEPFYNNEGYIDALSEKIRPFLNQDYDKILFSYHGIPERHILKGDITGNHCLKSPDCCQVESPAHKYCYRHQCNKTTALVVERLKIPKDKYELTFQSRLGRDPWLTPYTAKRLTELPDEGIKKLLIVCPAFVSDCLETLQEISGEGSGIFMNAGGTSLTMIPCLNTDQLWIKALVTMVKQEMSD